MVIIYNECPVYTAEVAAYFGDKKPKNKKCKLAKLFKRKPKAHTYYLEEVSYNPCRDITTYTYYLD